jgi:hypothetical protein
MKGSDSLWLAPSAPMSKKCLDEVYRVEQRLSVNCIYVANKERWLKMTSQRIFYARV